MDKDEMEVIRIIHHEVNSLGQHRQWVVEEDGTRREIFKGDEEWED